MRSPHDAMTFGPLALLDEGTRDRIHDRARERRLTPGDVLIRESAPDDDAYLLVDGTLRVTAADEPRMLAIVSAPALVGEIAAVTEQRRSATVVADTPCTVLVLPGGDLRALMHDRPVFATAMRERADLLRADALLKRHSPLRDLPSEIVTSLASHLRPRVLAHDQLIAGNDDDIYLIRRGAIARLSDGTRTAAGEFVQRVSGERYAAVDETWIYELRLADVARAIVTHQERLREIAEGLGDRIRVKLRPGCSFTPDSELGGVLVHDARSRALVTEDVATVAASLDGKHDVATIVRESRLARGPVVEGIAVLIAADLATIIS